VRATSNDAQPLSKVLRLRRRFPFEDGFKLQEGRTATAEQVIEQLERFVSEDRMARMRQARACKGCLQCLVQKFEALQMV